MKGRRKLGTEEVAEQMAQEGTAAVRKPKTKRAASKPKKEKAKRERKVKAPKDGKRPKLRREANRAAEGKTIGFTRDDTKTAAVVEYAARHKRGVDPVEVGEHFSISPGAARVRLWRAVMAGKLREEIDGRKKRYFAVEQ